MKAPNTARVARFLRWPGSYALASLLTGVIPGRKQSLHVKDGWKFALELTRDAYLERKPVIWTSTFVPTELVYGLGALPFQPEVAAAVAAAVNLAPLSLRRAETGWLVADACSFHRCAFGLQDLDLLPRPVAVVVASHLCDGVKRLLQEMAARQGVPFYLLDVPYRPGPAAETWLSDQIEQAVRSLAGRSAGLDPAGLPRALELSNQARKYCLEAWELRKSSPTPWKGSQALNYTGIFFLAFGSEQGVAFYRSLATDLRGRIAQGWLPEEKYRLLWLHLRPYYPQPLFRLIEEERGVAIAFEEYNYLYWPELDPARPYLSLARKMLAHPGWGHFSRRLAAVLYLARAYRVDGVVQFGQWGCRQSNGAAQMLKEALAREGLPFLHLDGDGVDVTNYFEGPTLTRLEAFLELLEYRRWPQDARGRA